MSRLDEYLETGRSWRPPLQMPMDTYGPKLHGRDMRCGRWRGLGRADHTNPDPGDKTLQQALCAWLTAGMAGTPRP